LRPDGEPFIARMRSMRYSRAVRSPRRGRILAVKWGYNPNSSSLGVDVTFLLFGMAFVALLTPIVSLLLRARRAALPPPVEGEPSSASAPEAR
jgi:hypothetical protein